MPFIDVKLSKKISEEEKELLKSDLGSSISILRKPESYLMIGIVDGYNLYFAGKKLENGAFVSVSVFGQVSSADAERMTTSICDILNKRFCVSCDSVYVTYSGVKDWGWNGKNF